MFLRVFTSSFGRIGLGIYAAQVRAKHPEDFTAALLKDSCNQLSCRALVIAVAKWPGSRFQGYPYLFDRYYAGVKGIVETVSELFADRADDVRVYMRSIHENPIGERIGKCPIMADWRSPDVIHGYTYLMKKRSARNTRESRSCRQDYPFLGY